MIDLHTHSNCSDGDYTPEEVVRLAEHAGLSAVSLTDHDTLEGSKRAVEAGEKGGIRVVPGVEISTSFRGKVLHVLGYFIDLENAPLRNSLKEICEYRNNRARSIVENINQELEEDGKTSIDVGKVLALGAEKPLTRPDIAGFLVEHGYVKTRNDAFTLWLNKYNIPNKSFSVGDAATLIHGAGGVAILAHPYSEYLSLRAISELVGEHREMLRELQGDGLDGIEAYRYNAPKGKITEYREMAKSLGLLVSGGSDFHGPGNALAAQSPGANRVPDQVLGNLENVIH